MDPRVEPEDDDECMTAERGASALVEQSVWSVRGETDEHLRLASSRDLKISGIQNRSWEKCVLQHDELAGHCNQDNLLLLARLLRTFREDSKAVVVEARYQRSHVDGAAKFDASLRNDKLLIAVILLPR